MLRIGLIQTTLDNDLAWDSDTEADICMHKYEANRVWNEIKSGFAALKTEPAESLPHIVVLPELTLPLYREKELENIAKKIGCVVFAGLDFIDSSVGVMNQGIAIVPNKWPKIEWGYSVSKFFYGKRFFSTEEKIYFKNKEKKELPTPYVHIIDAADFGKIGVAICADFFDIERFTIYKGKIHHLIIIAYNKDVNSFFFLAEAISRLVFCNVVVCNSGHFGGSVVFSPYKDSFKRNIFKLEGKNIFNVQIVSIPVKSLDKARNIDDDDIDELRKSPFKSRPPGYGEVIVPKLHKIHSAAEIGK